LPPFSGTVDRGWAREPGGDAVREEFRAELAQVSRLLVDMAEAARLAMRKATVALLEGDRTEAEQVAMTDNEIDALFHRV